MTLTIPDELLGTKMTEEELRLELAVAMYAANRMSFGKARKLAGLDWFRFRQILAERNVPMHYGVEQLEEDLRTIENMPA
jgi:predicted HTH domain antitoxin